MESLLSKARNYFILGSVAESLGMPSEAACNFFQALFAADDAKIFDLVKEKPKDSAERMTILKARLPALYSITDRLMPVYRRSKTMDIEMPEARIIKNRVIEAFEQAGMQVPREDEVRKKVEEILKAKVLKPA